ncbi:MAG: hypothetical protein OEV33_00275 [Armatimonadota bacterium]|nr:hypothetical protein [Armatimonadota bacterium]
MGTPATEDRDVWDDCLTAAGKLVMDQRGIVYPHFEFVCGISLQERMGLVVEEDNKHTCAGPVRICLDGYVCGFAYAMRLLLSGRMSMGTWEIHDPPEPKSTD